MEDLHRSLLPGIQSFGPLLLLLGTLLLLGSAIAQNHSLVTQQVLELVLALQLSAVLQEPPREGLGFGGMLSLQKETAETVLLQGFIHIFRSMFCEFESTHE